MLDCTHRQCCNKTGAKTLHLCESCQSFLTCLVRLLHRSHRESLLKSCSSSALLLFDHRLLSACSARLAAFLSGLAFSICSCNRACSLLSNVTSACCSPPRLNICERSKVRPTSSKEPKSLSLTISHKGVDLNSSDLHVQQEVNHLTGDALYRCTGVHQSQQQQQQASK